MTGKIVAELVDGRIEITSGYDDRELVKTVPGVKWDADVRIWHVPVSWAACVQLRGVFGDRLVVGDTLRAWALEERMDRIDPALALRAAEDAEHEHSRLYPYQRAGVAFLRAAGFALLADEPGLGKTAQSLFSLDPAKDFPVLVVCPNSMKLKWKQEVEQWLRGRTAVAVSGGAAARAKAILSGADVVIINWEALRSESRLAGFGSIALSEKDRQLKTLNMVEWQTVIADEAHRAKDPKAQQTRALWAVSRNASRRIALTGTPVTSTPDDLWAILHFLDPAEWPSRPRYIDRYCLQSWSPWGLDIVGLRGDTRDEFFKILDPRFLRREKSTVLTQMPAKRYEVRRVEMGTRQAKAYRQMLSEMLVELDTGLAVATNPLTHVLRLLQFASACATVDPETGRIILSTPSCKVDALLELVDERAGDPVVVFAQSRQLIEICAAALEKAKVRYVSVTGGQTTFERQDAVDLFQTGSVPVCLATLGAGGEGITLTAADTVVFLQRDWSMVKNLQAEDRVHRIGQDRAVTVVDIRVADTAEDRVVDAVNSKLRNLQEVVRDAAELRRLLKGDEE